MSEQYFQAYLYANRQKFRLDVLLRYVRSHIYAYCSFADARNQFSCNGLETAEQLEAIS
jgi:hypothetical protein